VCGRGTEKRGSASEQGLGRSRVGFSTKMVLTAVDENTPVAVEVLLGQVHEATQVEKMLDASQARLPQIEEAVADKGFDGKPRRQAMPSSVLQRRIRHEFDGKPQRQAMASREHPAGDSLSGQSAKTGSTKPEGVCGMQQDRTADRQVEGVSSGRHTI
jgi:hypothetical protein